MTLQEINARLDLYPEYLKYWIDKRVIEIQYPKWMIEHYLKHGLFFHWEEGLWAISFDEWIEKQNNIPVIPLG